MTAGPPFSDDRRRTSAPPDALVEASSAAKMLSAGDVSPSALVETRVTGPGWRVPASHPLRRVRALADDALAAVFPALEARGPAREIPLEWALKATLLMALYSVRDERQLCEQLDYNLLFRWFLDLARAEPCPTAAAVQAARQELLSLDVARDVLQDVVQAARRERLLDRYQFSVDRARLEEWAPTSGARRQSSWPPPVAAGSDAARAAACSPGTFCWLELTATEPDMAVAFYSGLFGWSTRPAPGRAHHLLYELRGRPVASLHALPVLQRMVGMRPRWTPYVAVDALDDRALDIRALGGELEGPFEALDGGRDAVLLDPSGAALGLWEPRPTSTPIVSNEPGAPCWYELQAPDPARARFFYGHVFEWGARGEGAFASWIRDGVAIGGLRELVYEASALHHGWTVYFEVEDLTATTRRASELGAHVSLPPTDVGAGGALSVLTDPQGATFGLLRR